MFSCNSVRSVKSFRYKPDQLTVIACMQNHWPQNGWDIVPISGQSGNVEARVVCNSLSTASEITCLLLQKIVRCWANPTPCSLSHLVRFKCAFWYDECAFEMPYVLKMIRTSRMYWIMQSIHLKSCL